MNSKVLTVIMPAFNEENTISQIISKVLSQSCVNQLIIIDDGSTDSTAGKIEQFTSDNRVKFIQQERNAGKGAAIKTVQIFVESPFVIIQDADLEYDPSEYIKFIEPLKDGKADVILGSRFQTGEIRRVSFFWHYLGNKFLTLLSNAFTNLNLTDMECCYIAMKSQLFKDLNLVERGFGNQPEMIAKLASRKCVFYEVSVSYFGRSYEEGKKINYRDGFNALYCIIKYNIFCKK